MSINVYSGLQGSGKSFEVVSSVILEAVMHGRRVVTNVSGIDEDKIHEYLVNTRDADPQKLGPIIHVSSEQILQPGFFPDEELNVASLVVGGDLVAIDEAWRFWGTDCGKLSHEHMQFFRMHRHYVHKDTAVTCDVVLMTQDIAGLHRSVKNVVEYTYRMHKHKSLGFSSRYRVEIYEGWKCNARTRIDTRQKSYDKNIFPLYQSYAGGSGSESLIDSRSNVFSKKLLWMYIIGFFFLGSFSLYFTIKFFTPKKPPVSDAQKLAQENKSSASASASASSPSPVSTIEYSDSLRVSGSMTVNGKSLVILSLPSGRVRFETTSNFVNNENYVGIIEGQKVSKFTGADFKQRDNLELKK